MFLHLIHAEPDGKFVEPIRRMFEAAAPGRHLYALVGDLSTDRVMPEEVAHVSTPGDFPTLFDSESGWEGMVVHGLPFEHAAPILRRIPKSLAVAWYVWGYEAYESWPQLSRQLLMPETRRVANRLAGPRHRLLQPWINRSCERVMREVADRYDYVVARYEEEFDVFVKSGLLKETRYHCGSVGSLEDVVDSNSGVVSGRDVQVGNSAAMTNNHLDAFLMLGDLSRDARSMIVPLAYGDSRYGALVAARGRAMMGERCLPLVGFVPLDEYLKAVASCGHVVMNHLRQQALGNIYAALWRGARVYMNDTAAFRGLRRIGLPVQLIQAQLGHKGMALQREPSEEEVLRHREVLRNCLGKQWVVSSTLGLLEKLAHNRARFSSYGSCE